LLLISLPVFLPFSLSIAVKQYLLAADFVAIFAAYFAVRKHRRKNDTITGRRRRPSALISQFPNNKNGCVQL
jgi:hypothetical protein